MAPIIHLGHSRPNDGRPEAVCGLKTGLYLLTVLITDNYLDYSSVHWGRKGPPTCPSCLMLYTDDPSLALVLTFP